MGYLTRTLLLLAIGFSIVPVICWSFTVEEYFSLAPELLSTLANIQLSLYTVCAASFVGFYFFGWNARWPLRVLGALFFLAALEGMYVNYEKTYHTILEAQYRYFLSNDLCAEEEPFRRIYEGFNAFRCSEYFTSLSKQEQTEAMYLLLKDFDLLGRGFTWANVVSELPGTAVFRFASWTPLGFFSVLASLLIWLICPSKEYCLRKGWIRE